ncbi:MAG: YegS/Rv2252/BmrU family lipid kinase [Clostridia bacterium]|nr:YegS/Rv2252/BmrU family lipid kinase [Clostridia bacterium]
MNKKNNVLLIVNPCAGRTKGRAGTFDIVNKFSTNDFNFSIHTTTCRGDATNIVKKHYEGKDLVVCVGGDGTLNETINGIMDMPNRVPVGYIPTGTTNDLATTLGIPSDIKKATDLIMSGQTNSYDVGLFNNRYYSYVASFGAFSSASYTTSQKMKNMFGHSAYFAKGLMDWKSIRSYRVKIEHDGGVMEEDIMLGAITNSTSMGGIFKFDENAIKLNDGYFEVLLIKKINPVIVPKLFFAVQKKDYSHKSFVFLKTRQIKITCEEPIDWTVDGEFAGSHKVANINVLKRALEICSPENELFEKEEVPEIDDDVEIPEGVKIEKGRLNWRARRAQKQAEEEKEKTTSVDKSEAGEKIEKGRFSKILKRSKASESEENGGADSESASDPSKETADLPQ